MVVKLNIMILFSHTNKRFLVLHFPYFTSCIFYYTHRILSPLTDREYFALLIEMIGVSNKYKCNLNLISQY